MTQRQLANRAMYGPQTVAYDTAATVTTALAKFQTFTPVNDQGLVYSYGMGDGDYPLPPVYGPYTCGGTLEWLPVDFDFLKHWVGPRSGSGNSGSPYILTEDNAISTSSSDIQPFTLEIANTSETTNTVDTYIGCVGNSFTISGDLSRRIVCSSDFVARRIITSSTPTAYTANSNNPYMMINGAVQWGGTPASVSGVQNFSITHTNGLIPAPSIEDRFSQQPVVGQKKYSFRFTILMAQAIAATIVDHFYGKTNQPEDGSTSITPTSGVELKIEIINGTHNAIIWLDNCTIQKIEKVARVAEGLVNLTVSGTSLGGKNSQPIQWWT